MPSPLRSSSLRLALVTALLTASAWSVVGCTPQRSTTFDAPVTPHARQKIPDDALATITNDLATQNAAQMLVAVEPKHPAGLTAVDVDLDDFRFVRMALTKAELQRDVGDDLVVEDDYDHLPIQLVSVTSQDTIAKLLEDERVIAVDQIRTFETSTAESLPLIGQPTAFAEGKTGAGVSVAVLDTGVDFTRAAFGCTAVNTPASTCRVQYAQDFGGNDDGARDTGELHGTNVAGIVAAVAPGAKILALDVFPPTPPTTDPIIAAINFVIANKTTYNIAAMNLSLGEPNRGFTSACGDHVWAIAIKSARDAGILAAVATGNEGFVGAISAPACAPAAVSVAATYDFTNSGTMTFPGLCSESPLIDKVTCFSNLSSFTTIAAPGSSITAADIPMSGTSQASPHIAGAMAVLKASFPLETPDQIVSRMTTTGTMVTRGTISVPRLNLADAATGCVFGVTPLRIDTTNTTAHTETIDLKTGTGCAWSTATTGGFFTVSPASGSGSATLTVSMQANLGTVRGGSVTISATPNTNTTATARTVGLSQGADTTAPTGTVVINGGDATTRVPTVALSITADDPSGVPLMCVTESTTCTVFEPFAPSKTITLATTGNRTVLVFLKDSRGNTSTATTALKDTIIYDTAGPTGGALTVTPDISQLNLSWTASTDALSGIAGYRVVASNDAALIPDCARTTVASTNATVRTATVPAQNGIVTQFRVCPIDQAGNVGAGFTGSGIARAELTPPTGTIVINSPTPGLTRVATVSVTVTATDPHNVNGVCITSAATCTTFENITATPNFSRESSFTIAATTGLKTVNVFFRDELGNASTTPAGSATITFDATAPSAGTLTATPRDGLVEFAIAGVTDSPAGVAGFRVVRSEGTVAAPPVAPASCTVGTPSGEPTTSTFTVTGLTNRTVYAFRVCGVDNAGNLSAGVTKIVEPRAEFVVPTATVVINDGAVATRSLDLTVRINVTENIGIESMCVGLAATGCTKFDPVAQNEQTATTLTRTVTLPTATAGARSVFVTVRDVSGNTMTTPASDSIILDQAAPTGGALRVTPGSGSAVLAWTAPTDTPAGIAGYRLSVAENTPPATCADGTVLRDETTLTATATTFTQNTGLTNMVTYGWRLCAVDKAGNVATGLTITGKPQAEFAPPTATVVINDNAAFTKTTDVTLKITGTDASGVAKYCASNATGACSPFVDFTGSPMSVPFALTNTAGARTVFVTLQDTLGNTMTTPASDTITLDTTAPTGGALTVTPQVGSLKLTWTASSDANGIASYLVFAGATTPADCSGTPLATVTAPTATFTQTPLDNAVSVHYRVCPVDRAGNVGTGFTGDGTPRAELTGPVGTVAINGGATFTNSANLSVTISATDASGVAGLCVATTATGCSTTFDAYDGTETTKTVPVTATAGVKTVFVSLKDSLGNVSTTSKTITLDLTGPTGGALTFTLTQANALQLSWTASTDPAGVASYKVVTNGTSTAPANCDGIPLGTTLAATRTFSHTGLGSGTFAYRVCPVDTAGNVGAGFTGAGTPRAELDAPTGSVVIKGGALATNTSAVDVTISATDATGLGGFCVKADATACTTFTTMTTSPVTVQASLGTSTAAGVRTIFVTLKDALGNVTSVPVTDTIIFDSTPPTTSTMTVSVTTLTSTNVSLGWSTASDTPAGIKGYRLVALNGSTAPAVKCTTGTLLSNGVATSFSDTAVSAGLRTYRVCAEDNAGNVADGVTKTVRVPGVPSAGCGRTLLATDFQDSNGDGNPEAETTLVVGGVTRRAAIRVPSGYDPSFPLSIVYELHGDQNAGFTPDPSTFTQGIFGADEYGGAAIVIALRGENILAPQVRSDFSSFVSWDTLSSPAANLDIQALRAFRAYVESKACVETNKVFAVGFSGGGFLAQTMRCYGEDFRAVANFESGLDLPAYNFLRNTAGTFIHLDTTQCASTPVPQLIVHFGGDTTVVQQQGIDTANFWAAKHGCSARTSATRSAMNTACVEYANCGAGEDVVLCTPSGGAHEVWSPEGASVLLSFFNRFF